MSKQPFTRPQAAELARRLKEPRRFIQVVSGARQVGKTTLALQVADQEDMMRNFRIIVERYSDGYVGYPLGLKGVVVGQGDTYEEALADVKSAIRFHIETFGQEAFDEDPPVLEAFMINAEMAV